ncbi:MAG TPA: RNA polymerase-binding protein DksA [Gammaproteobacteria bacterium]|nr:RNA polymerase-binding protein DksA [Gammaproteobacteria bacterium]
MPAKKAASKKKTPASKKPLAKKAPKPVKRSAGAKSKAPQKSSSKKTVKPAKSASPKKVAKPLVAPKSQPKPTGTKTMATGPKKPAPKPAAVTASASAAPAPRRSGASILSGPVRGFTPYQPKRGEDYMSPGQLEHFRQLLLAWKRELMEEVDRTMLHMKDDAANFPDPNDRATQESEFGLELRTRDRERKLLKKIDSALARIDDGSYGYCEETGEEIGLRRLEARPVATLCVEAQERREIAERQFRDREDQYR